MTIKKALDWAFSQLASCSESARLDAEVLMQFVLEKNRTFLYSWPDKLLDIETINTFTALVNQRKKGRPIAHIIGVREFWSLEFCVNDTTLIPRPDTEVLIEIALNLSLDHQAKVLDLGTGTGAIALSLAYERPNWQIVAVDKIDDAVTLARKNRDKFNLKNVNILASDWFSAVDNEKFQLIVSNPPYIDDVDEHLQQGDVRFEPLTALVAAENGFADLFFIANEAKKYLLNGGYLLMEHGYQQGNVLRQKLNQLGYINVKTVPDYGGNDRCTIGQIRY